MSNSTSTDASTAAAGTADFSVQFTVKQSPEKVFEAVKNVRGWWAGDIEGKTDELNGEFTYRYQDLHRSVQKIVEFVPNSHVKWHVSDSSINFVKDKSEWNGTDITFDIAPTADGGSTLTFKHIGLQPQVECYGKCSGAWDYYIAKQLKTYIVNDGVMPAATPATATKN